MRRLLAVLLVIAALALAIARHPMRRYRASLDRREAERLVFRAEQSFGHTRFELAKAAIERAESALATDPADFKALVLRGAAEAAAGLPDRALASYRLAFALNQRPEILAYIGAVQLERGDIEAAMNNLTRAAEFNQNAPGRAIDSTTQELVAQRVRARRRARAAHGRPHAATAATKADSTS